jgi:hypothetical protein
VDHPVKCTPLNRITHCLIVNEEDIKAMLTEIKMLKDLNYYKITYKFKFTYIIFVTCVHVGGMRQVT